MRLIDILSDSNYCSGESVAAKLKITRAAVHKQITALRNKGFVIEGIKNLGYKIVSKPDLILPDKINGSLISHILYKSECVSTQVLAKEMAFMGVKHGTLVIAEKQTGSYGRFARKWESPRGGLWFSVVLKPEIMPENIPQLTLIISLSVAKVFEKMGIKSSIKWPNDILLERKKVAGILLEMSAEVGKTNWVVAGVGINVNNDIPENISGVAVSLSNILNKKIDRNKLLNQILTEFSQNYCKFVNHGFKPFRSDYIKRLAFLGKTIKFSTGTETVSGVAKTVDSSGYLVVKRDGKEEKILAGEITI